MVVRAVTRAALCGLLLVSACSSSGKGAAASGPAPSAPTVSGTTWADGAALRGTVTVPAGTTVTLAPGAHLAAAQGAKVVVAGTLLAPRGATLSGSGWDGITVASGGSVQLTDVALSGATNGLTTEAGARPSTLSGGSFHDVGYPLSIAAGTSLTVRDLDVKGVDGVSDVKGVLVADGLRYDKGSSTGILVSGPGSALRLTRSLLVGDGHYAGDMLNTDDAGELTVASTEIRDVHCAFHLVGVGKLTLDKVKVHKNAYGFMAYGSSTTTVHHITDTDVYDNRDFGLYESPGTTQGRILVDGGFWGRNGDSELASLTQSSGRVERTRPAAAPAA